MPDRPLTDREQQAVEAAAIRRVECPARSPKTGALCGLEWWVPVDAAALEWACLCGATCRLEPSGTIAAWHDEPAVAEVGERDATDLATL